MSRPVCGKCMFIICEDEEHVCPEEAAPTDPKPELLSCPFCGGPATFSQVQTASVFCDNRECPVVCYSRNITAELAIEAWNRRGPR